LHIKEASIIFLVTILICFSLPSRSEIYEMDGSPDATEDTPLQQHIKPIGEKFILVDPNEHVWGAYSTKGKLIRWGIATAGADWCDDSEYSCRTETGSFRIYSLGDSGCVSRKFPVPEGGAPMPYCMYFNGGQALHGSYEVEYANVSHGCIRIHVSDAKWLRYHFVDAPTAANNYRGTKIIIRGYENLEFGFYFSKLKLGFIDAKKTKLLGLSLKKCYLYHSNCTILKFFNLDGLNSMGHYKARAGAVLPPNILLFT